MSTIYAGNGANVSATVANQARQAISLSFDATPIRVFFASAHGFNTADTVEIEGHLINTNANGTWVVSVVDSVSVTLNGSVATGGGDGGATGYAIDYELLPALTIPSNGELADMGVIGAALEGAVDPVPYLYRAAGARRFYERFFGFRSDDTFSSQWSTNSPVAASYTNVANGASLLDFGGLPAVSQNGDLIDVTFDGTVGVTTASGVGCTVALAIGVSTDGGSTWTVLPHSAKSIQGTNLGFGPALGPVAPLAMRAFHAVSGASPFNYSVMAINLNPVVVTTLFLQGSYLMTATQYRRN